MTSEVLRIDGELTAIRVDGDKVEYVIRGDVDPVTEDLIYLVGVPVTIGLVPIRQPADGTPHAVIFGP